MMRGIFILIVILSVTAAFAQPAQKLVRSGNSDYNKGHFKEAEINYRKALSHSPGAVNAGFNLGNSLFKQQQFGEAAAQYKKLAESGNSRLPVADTKYNLGNSLFEAKQYPESIEAYKQALRLHPKDEDIRYNLAYALTKLQQQQQKQQQQKQEKKNEQQKQQQPQTQQPRPNMSKQDADRMLNAMNNNEKRTLDKTKKNTQQRSQPQPEKDW